MTKKSTSEQAEMNAHEVAKFERIACGGIYEMVSTLRGLPPADGLDETDVRYRHRLCVLTDCSV